MNAVTPVTITTPDGVERQLRFTLGAQRRIQNAFGMDLHAALNKYDTGALPEILYALMHDSKGNPPDLSVAELAESLPIEANVEILAAIMSAASQGKIPKNVLETQIKATALERVTQMLQAATNGGLAPGVSASRQDTSESHPATSGGDISTAKSRRSLRGTKSLNGSAITASV